MTINSAPAATGWTLGGGQLLFLGASSATLSDGGSARPITVNASGGTLGAAGGNFSFLSIPGVISGAGQVQFGGGTQSNATGNVNLNNPAANTYTGGTLISPGVLAISNPSQLGSGPILLNGGTLRASAALAFATPLTAVQDSTLDLSTSNVTLSAGISGSAGASGTAATSLVFTTAGSSAFTLDGDSTFAGTLNLRSGLTVLRGTLSAASAITTDSTFRLGISDGIHDRAALTFTSGALETQGFGDTLGTLTIASSTFGTFIALGTGPSILRFAASQAQPWTGTLSITNWSGLTAGGGTDQLFFGIDATGLTAGQLAAIAFLNPAGFAPGTYPAFLRSTGELVAVVPEPGTTALLLGCFALLGLRRAGLTRGRPSSR